MIKTTKKSVTVQVEVKTRICDLCEKPMVEGSGFFRVAPGINEANGRSFSVHKEVGIFDVCSADCLSKRGKAIGLVADTKIFPALRKEMGEQKKAYPMIEKAGPSVKEDCDITSFSDRFP